MPDPKPAPEQALAPAATIRRKFRVSGPKGTFEVVAADAEAARHWYRNETALDPEAAKGLDVAELPAE